MTEPQHPDDVQFDSAEATAPMAPAEPPPALALDLADEDMAALADIAGVAIELIDVMDEETEKLKTFKLDDVMPVIERKKQLSELYALKNQALSARLGRRTLDLGGDAKAAFTRLAQMMRESAERNALMIKAAQDANQMFIDAVRDSLRDQARPVSTYGRNGRQVAPNAYQQRTVPVYSDRRL